MTPVEEISKELALDSSTYCVAFYDESGKIYRFEKHFEGELFFRHDYKYGSHGNIIESKVLNRDGEERVNKFDSKPPKKLGK